MEEQKKDAEEIIENAKAPEAKKAQEEKCPFCGAKVQPTDIKCSKCHKNLRGKKADKQRAVNNGTYHDVVTMVVAIVTGSIFMIFIIIAIIGLAMNK